MPDLIVRLLAAEDVQSIAERSTVDGIGVGMDPDYGAAQRLYVKRGYVPDGRGLSSNGRHVRWGDTVSVNDRLNLHFTKDLVRTPPGSGGVSSPA